MKIIRAIGAIIVLGSIYLTMITPSTVWYPIWSLALGILFLFGVAVALVPSFVELICKRAIEFVEKEDVRIITRFGLGLIVLSFTVFTFATMPYVTDWAHPIGAFAGMITGVWLLWPVLRHFKVP